MNKRGQVTIFIIIAILIIAAVILFFSFKDQLGIFTPKSDPVYLFTQNCIEDTGKDAISYITSNGGYLNPLSLSTSSGIPYYYHNNQSYLPTKERIEQEISSYIENSLSSCTDGFLNFPNLNITEGEIKATTAIEDNKIKLNVEYPLTITKGQSTSRFDSFENIIIDSDLGEMYNSIRDIIQEQLGEENICLSCIYGIADAKGFTMEMVNTEEGVIFSLRDENSKIKDVPVEWRFANQY